jgi:hypothetical protein
MTEGPQVHAARLLERICHNPMMDGGSSSITGIMAPPRFSRDVWSELVRRGELRGGRQGVYELAKE